MWQPVCVDLNADLLLLEKLLLIYEYQQIGRNIMWAIEVENSCGSELSDITLINVI